MNIEREFFDNLQKAKRFEIKAGKLNLYESDLLLLTFGAQEEN
jgi:heat shock protein HslJ